MKAFIKSCLVCFSAYIHRELSPKMVFYHDIGTAYTPMGTSSQLFWAHMKLLRKDDQVAFDDGFRGIWEQRERLLEAGIRPVVFIAVSLMGKPGHLNWDEARTLSRDYGFSFGSHTWSHQTLSGDYLAESPREERTEAWFKRELEESKNEIERQLMTPVTALCFPAGHFSANVISRSLSAGYRHLYSSLPRVPVSLTAELLPRLIVQDLSPKAFSAALRGGLGFLSSRYFAQHYSEE